MKFNKPQRHLMYVVMKEELKGLRLMNGFCSVVSRCFDRSIHVVYDDDVEIGLHLPELLKRKPENTQLYSYWFPTNEEGRKKRLAILHECIVETTY